MNEPLARPAWHKVVPLAGLAVVLAFALWWDGDVTATIQREMAATFTGLERFAWLAAFGQLVGAGLVLVDGWLLFRWAPHSRFVGFAITVISGYVLLFTAISFTTGWDLPFWREIQFDAGGRYSVLTLVVPFLTLFGLIRMAWPLPRRIGRG